MPHPDVLDVSVVAAQEKRHLLGKVGEHSVEKVVDPFEGIGGCTQVLSMPSRIGGVVSEERQVLSRRDSAECAASLTRGDFREPVVAKLRAPTRVHDLAGHRVTPTKCLLVSREHAGAPSGEWRSSNASTPPGARPPSGIGVGEGYVESSVRGETEEALLFHHGSQSHGNPRAEMPTEGFCRA